MGYGVAVCKAHSFKNIANRSLLSDRSSRRAIDLMKLPDFKSESEEIKFWEKHSIAEYWEDLKESDESFKRPKLTPVTMKFDPLVVNDN